MPNINVVESSGSKLEKRIITNSLGFRDYNNKIIEKKSLKKRVLLIRDSFIVGNLFLIISSMVIFIGIKKVPI